MFDEDEPVIDGPASRHQLSANQNQRQNTKLVPFAGAMILTIGCAIGFVVFQPLLAGQTELQQRVASLEIQLQAAKFVSNTVPSLPGTLDTEVASDTSLSGQSDTESASGTRALGERLESLDEALTVFRTSLEDYYGVTPDSNVMLDGFITKDGPLYDTIMGNLALRFARKLQTQGKFVVGMIGSSNTAGHGNCYNDTWPQRLKYTLAPLLAEASVEFEVRPAAIGGSCGDNFANRVFCMSNLLGFDVDATIYEYHYYESARDGGISESIHEQFMRFSLMMPNAPFPMLLSLHGEGKCYMSDFDLKLMEHYGHLGANKFCTEMGLEKTFKARNITYAKIIPGVVGDGLHNTTRFGKTLNTTDPSQAARQKSLGVVWRNWHPGPLSFERFADSIAYYYSTALLMAVQKLQKDAAPVAVPNVILPPPLSPERYPNSFPCKEEGLCTLEMPPACWTIQLPNFGTPQITLMEPSNPSNPLFKMMDAQKGDWVPWHSSAAPRVPALEKALPGCQLQDKCGGYLKEKGVDLNPISFLLSAMKVGRIAVFFQWDLMASKEEKKRQEKEKKGNLDLIEGNVKFYIGDMEVPWEDITYEFADNSIVVENKYKPEYASHDIYTPDTGHMVLSIVAAPDIKVVIKQINTM